MIHEFISFLTDLLSDILESYMSTQIRLVPPPRTLIEFALVLQEVFISRRPLIVVKTREQIVSLVPLFNILFVSF